MSGGSRLLLVAAAALIDGEGRVLMARRPEGKAHAGLWEFPGGKVEAGERPEAALARELHEELGVRVEVEDLEPVAFASEPSGGRHLLMPLWMSRRWTGAPAPLEGQTLAWASPRALATAPADWPMPPADRPLLAALVDRLDRRGPFGAAS